MTKLELLRLPFIVNLTYERKLRAQWLIENGADYALLYFWFNLTSGFYNAYPESVIRNDMNQFSAKYPAFAGQIIAWRGQVPPADTGQHSLKVKTPSIRHFTIKA